MKHIHTFESFLNEGRYEGKASWKEKSGVTEFEIHGTTYSLYNVDKKKTWELYKFDEDNGPMIMRFKIENGSMFFLYGGFDLDRFANAYRDEIIDAVCSFFKIDKKNIVYENSMNEGRKTNIEVSLRYAAKALDAFEDGNWMKMSGKITSTNTFEFRDEDMAMDFVETLTRWWEIPKNEITVK